MSELLRSVVPLLNDLGLVADWRIIRGDERFFEVTKAIHNGLQGAAGGLDDGAKASYLKTSRENAKEFLEEYDFVFMHDPQPAAILPLRGKGGSRWIWRCHIDTSSPNPQVWDFMRAFLTEYDAAMFTMEEFVPRDFPVARVEIVPPAIDPLSPKNLPLPRALATQVLEWIGIRLDRPLVTQVSRFDPWKDPLGVVSAYRLARREFPGLQLALVGSLALDDPEGWGILSRDTSGDRVRSARPRVHERRRRREHRGERVPGALARRLQKSLREGFGLVVSEALWKGTPIVAGRAGGIPLQMADGTGGILVDSVEECGEAIASLLRDPSRADSLGRSGRERVRHHFLVPRLVLNELAIVRELAGDRPITRAPGWLTNRDPVCGMIVEETAVASDRRRTGPVLLRPMSRAVRHESGTVCTRP